MSSAAARRGLGRFVDLAEAPLILVTAVPGKTRPSFSDAVRKSTGDRLLGRGGLTGAVTAAA